MSGGGRSGEAEQTTSTREVGFGIDFVSTLVVAVASMFVLDVAGQVLGGQLFRDAWGTAAFGLLFYVPLLAPGVLLYTWLCRNTARVLARLYYSPLLLLLFVPVVVAQGAAHLLAFVVASVLAGALMMVRLRVLRF